MPCSRPSRATSPSQVIELDDGFAVVGTDEVIAADPAKDPDGVQQLRTELETDMRNDLLAQFEAELRRDYPVEIDGAAINRLIGSDGQMPASGAPRPLPTTSERALRAPGSGHRCRHAPTLRSSRPATTPASRSWSGPPWSPTSRRPVSAMLKLAEGRPYSFLLESVEGGAVRGRYSAIGLKPDLIWRCFGERAEINRARAPGPERVRALPRRRAGRAARPDRASRGSPLAEGLPPMAAGLFGYMGYDMVRLMERLPDANPDPLGVPDAVFMRPTVIAIFDNIEDQVTVVTPVWPAAGSAARARPTISRASGSPTLIADFDRGLPHRCDSIAGRRTCPSRART